MRRVLIATAVMVFVHIGYDGERVTAQEPLTAAGLQAALAAKPTGAAAEQLADRIRTWFGGPQALADGGAAKIEDLLVAFAVEAPAPEGAGPGPRVSSDAVLFMMPLTRVAPSWRPEASRAAIVMSRPASRTRSAPSSGWLETYRPSISRSKASRAGA